ncbi:UMP kinase [bacterium endosymbiont of Pedicinus badii]|uniref:UMP kinase n=1 Tax=bacterium endosymbiont of Pedicinus badii TaxID=1719126 RepID=UPI0009BB5EAE|nr:UMP kinase [bacterium endosymbiont of Pedicinus badii]OQM33999.1 uridylate kinase [bacterium endosymbiont of Pedicinus badii]
MKNLMQPIYKRILLKLSGEYLQGKKKLGIDFFILNRIAVEIKELISMGVQVGLVVGGGNLFRGYYLKKIGINKIIADQIGMLSTIINGLVVTDALRKIHSNVCLMSPIPISNFCESYSYMKAISLLCNNYIVIFASGIGIPFFSTDSAACIRGIEIKANIILKATKVNGVYSKDPGKEPKAFFYEKISYEDILRKKLKVMDLTAFTIAKEHNLPIRIFNIDKLGALKKIILGGKEGTLITK